jgi:DNA-binding response OmpR family regulator
MSNENKKKVLVVDDDDNLRLPLTDKLKIEGFEVSEAKDGKEGLEKALELQPDVILLDIMMPVMSGWEMFGKLRKDKRGKEAKVIMLTVIGDSGSIARVMQDGKASYLIKTEQNLDSIVEKVKSVIENNS